MNLRAALPSAEGILDRLVHAECLARRLGPQNAECRVANALPGQLTGRPAANDVHDGVDIRRCQMLSQDQRPTDGSFQKAGQRRSFGPPRLGQPFPGWPDASG